ncbi:MAG: glutathione S-transferase family protein [Oscillatoriales cyanobacterium RM2_1_1]|nr:glutathione S-transferase family protein [Oscillatoriales cyanobacterium SM2_3_0]NJO44968.1 glutathione S-transferase family protein [Oscillatoriales cyanobacterium RM2_1_1]
MTPLTLVIGNKNYSSWSLRPWLALKQAGLDFQEVRILLDTPDTHQQIRQYSPSGRLPVLLHDHLTVWESLAICEYIAENFAPDLWPEDVGATAIARSVSHEMHAGFINLRMQMPMDCRARYPGEGIKPEVRTDIERIKAIWRHCRKTFGQGGTFLFGQFSIADAMFAPVVSRFITYDVKLDPDEQDYSDAIWAMPAMEEWMASADQESEYLHRH